jgi:histone H3
MPRNKIAGKK